jgi:hypothetical protein
MIIAFKPLKELVKEKINFWNIFKRKEVYVCPDFDKKRFCCWCGKVEHTETCQSKSLKKCVKEAVNHYKNNGYLSGCTPEAERIIKEKPFKMINEKKFVKLANKVKKIWEDEEMRSKLK